MCSSILDLPVLSVAVALLARARRFDRVEVLLLASTVPSIFGFLWLPIPTALFATLAIGAIVLRRALREHDVRAFALDVPPESEPLPVRGIAETAS